MNREYALCSVACSGGGSAEGCGRLPAASGSAGGNDRAAGVPSARRSYGARQLVEGRTGGQHRLGQIPRACRRRVGHNATARRGFTAEGTQRHGR